MLRRTTLLALAPLISGTASSTRKQITVATEGADPPWNFAKLNGSVAGYEIDLIDALCTRMLVQRKVVTRGISICQ
jgi:octopine/nopaline transport system substrate-binding protein